MSIQMFDVRTCLMLGLLLLALVLVLTMTGGLTMTEQYEQEDAPANGEAWFYPTTDYHAPKGDCGNNYTLKFIYRDQDGNPCEVTKGTVSKDFVERIKEQFKGEGDTGASVTERALKYIEEVIWRNGYTPPTITK